MSHMGDNLRIIREKRNISITKLAEMTEISRSQITKIESGSQKNPGIKTLVALSTALCVPLEELVFGEIDEQAEIRSQLKAINDLNKEQKEVAKQLLRTWFVLCKTDEMNK